MLNLLNAIHRLNAKHKNANIYPPYNKIIETKARCYPKNKSMLTTEKSAEIKRQTLLKHTV
jgi:hypothetical protein